MSMNAAEVDNFSGDLMACYVFLDYVSVLCKEGVYKFAQLIAFFISGCYVHLLHPKLNEFFC